MRRGESDEQGPCQADPSTPDSHAAWLALTAAFDMSPPGRGVAHPVFSAARADMMRALLLAEMRERVTELAHQAARLAVVTIDPSADPTAFDRAMSAMHMYCARTAIEEIDHALVRIELGRYGICQECDRPIPFDRLEATPSARFCAGCTTPERSIFRRAPSQSHSRRR